MERLAFSVIGKLIEASRGVTTPIPDNGFSQ
jgi:hypothetical protein